MSSSFGPSNFGGGMKSADRPSRGVGKATTADLTASRPKPKLKKVLPEVWKLVKPRRWLLAGSFLLMIVNRLCSFALPVSSRYLINNVMYKHQLHLLPYIIGTVAAATFLQGITSYTLTQLLSNAGQRLISELRTQVQQHIGRLPVAFYDENRTGTLVARIMTDVEGVRNLVGTGLLEFVGGILTAIIAFCILIRISGRMTLLTFCILLVFGLILQSAFKTIRPIFRERAKINAEVTGRLTESLGGVRVVKGYHAEESEARVFAARRPAPAQERHQLHHRAVADDPLLHDGPRRRRRPRHVPRRPRDRRPPPRRRRLRRVHHAPGLYDRARSSSSSPSAPSSPKPSPASTAPPRSSTSAKRTASPPAPSSSAAIHGDVAFQDVTFAYEPDKPVLHGISFESKPGTVTALVGSSGSGKSTIISLICGFHTATGGQVLIDGIDLATIRLSSYRQQLGVVLQETFLFDGTIRENILFSRPKATEEQLMEACRIARVDEFAERFPEQYDTIVGERGVKLSGGQRQRISIARAILADPRILILDEATSSLDSESEAMIQNGLNFLMQGRTTFVIAHRLSTIRRADQILVVEQGQHRRARHPRVPLPAPAAATTTSTPASTASKPTSSSPPAKATRSKNLEITKA